MKPHHSFTSNRRPFTVSLAALALVASACVGNESPGNAGASTGSSSQSTSGPSITTTVIDADAGTTTTAINGSTSTTVPRPDNAAPVPPADPFVPNTVWGFEQGTADLVQIEHNVGIVLDRMAGFGAEAASGEREGGVQALTDMALGDGFAWVGTCCEPAVGAVFRVELGSGEAVADSGIEISGTAPALSPDESLVAVQVLDIGIAIHDATTGELLVAPQAIGPLIAVPETDQPTFAKPVSWIDDSTLAVGTDHNGQSFVTLVSIVNQSAPSAVGPTIEIDGVIVGGATRGDGALVTAVLGSDDSTRGSVHDPDSGEELATFELPDGTNSIDYDTTGTWLVISTNDAVTTWVGGGAEGSVEPSIYGAAWFGSRYAPPVDVSSRLESFETSAVTAAGLEGIGCYFDRNGNEADTVFHAGLDRGYLEIDDQQVIFDTSDFDPETDTLTADGVSARFTSIGPQVSVSIEATERRGTLEVTPANGDPITVNGFLWCGI